MEVVLIIFLLVYSIIISIKFFMLKLFIKGMAREYKSKGEYIFSPKDIDKTIRKGLEK